MPDASSSTPRAHLATLDDLLRIPEEQRFHEVLDGELVKKAMPGGEHGLAQGRVRGSLTPFDRRPGGPTRPGGWWIVTEVTVELAHHEVIQPDLCGWRRERMPEPPRGYPVRMRPDWVCEILTDGDARRRDGVQKRRIYADHEVPYYWLVDAERKLLLVLRLAERGYVEVLEAHQGERVRAEPFEALELSVGILFGDDPD
jgi:Uma2 family endonuclease